MPLFMDRHYSENATREAIELAHLKDLEIQKKYGVKFLTYWFDEDRGTTFCLVEAEDESTIRKVHQEAHGDIPNEIIPVDPNSVRLFLGRIEDPVPVEEKAADEIDSAFRVIMFTDLVGSTAMTTKLGDKKSMHLLRIHNALTRTALKQFNGREIKHTGDGFMVSFVCVEDAAKCAGAIVRSFADHCAKHPEETMQVRIGLSAGEPVEENNDLFGSTVQMAARVCDAAGSGQILATESVVEAGQVSRDSIKPCGEKTFKGFDLPVSLYEVSSEYL